MASSAVDRVATAVLEWNVRRLWGFPPRLVREIVADLGPYGAVAWFGRNIPRYRRTFHAFGALRTHLMCLAISLVNNCPYCVRGDGLGLQLAYLRNHGKLFPLGERTVEALCGQSPALVRHRLAVALQRSGLHGEVPWLDRAMTLAVTDTPVATDLDEVRIAHLVRMYRTLNRIARDNDTEPDQAHSPLNKDHWLKMRYEGLRATERA